MALQFTLRTADLSTVIIPSVASAREPVWGEHVTKVDIKRNVIGHQTFELLPTSSPGSLGLAIQDGGDSLVAKLREYT